MKQVCALLRNTGSGWFIISDADHHPKGVASVDTNSDHIRLHYDFTAKEVHTFVAMADETYILDDLLVGASIGMAYANIYFHRVGTSGWLDPATLTEAYGNINVFGVFS